MTSPAPPPAAPAPRPQSRDVRSPLRIVLSGYYGHDNLGDEAILGAIVQQLRALAPVELVALSGNPAQTEASLGIRAVGRLAPWAIARALRGADLFISGGGSLLQDVTGLGSVPYYLGLVQLARALGTPTMFYAQGIGPLNLATSRYLVGRVARGVDALVVRDEGSRELLASCGVSAERIEVTADPVLAMASAPADQVDALFAELGLDPRRPTLGVAVRPWASWYERQLKSFSAVLAQQAEAWGAQILLLPFHRPDDHGINDELSYCLATRPAEHRPFVATLMRPVTPAQMLGLVGRCDLLVGMRLHALIMAAAAAVPAVGLVYDPKITAFSHLAGFPTVASVTALEDAGQVGELLAREWDQRANRRLALVDRRGAWRLQAERTAQLAIELAGRAHARRA